MGCLFEDQSSPAYFFFRACHLCDLDPSRYKGHSFRIGAASYAADRGFSDAQIRMLGRWKSNAFLRYLRVPNLKVPEPIIGLIVITDKVGQFAWVAASLCCYSQFSCFQGFI